ncbi:SgcJ/EcaC family oxidoreductase [Streptosporangium carneum]|uniref:SgcJ/EcaC family oxidoreductase n=1 Tax=Streptosporangium carneum TaxID=47481 RepID=UPI0034D96C46
MERLFADFPAAWTAGDAQAFGALFTDDSDYVSYDGTIARGRRTHQHNHDKLFRGVLASADGARRPPPPHPPAQPRQALPRRPGQR